MPLSIFTTVNTNLYKCPPAHLEPIPSDPLIAIMSLSQLPVELLLDIISYLLAPIKTISPWICSSEYNPELNYQDLSSLFALSVTNRRLFAIVTPVLREIAIAETRRIRIRSADYYSECIGHHPGPLFLAIWTGNLRLTQELFKYVPADELPAGGAKMPYMIEGYSHKELRYASVDFPSFDMIDVRYMDNDCWYPGPESLEYMPKLKCAWACPIPIRNAFLYTAIRAGHVDVARWLLDNMHLMGGGDTLHPFLVPQHAVASGNTEMLDMVRERCDPRWRDKCLLREAMLHHDVAMVRWILERGITGEVGTMQKFAQYWYTMMDVTVFEWACKFSSLEIVKLLVEHDSKRHDPEERVYWYEYDSINRKTRRWLAWVKELQRPDDPSTPNSKSEPMLLMWDCFQVTGTRPPGRIDSMKSNARNPFDPLENLLARNADWDLIKSVFERAPEKARSRARESMLHFAVREDRLDLARHLLYDLKIDVNALNKMGQVPLMSTESVEMLHLLMEAGAGNVNPLVYGKFSNADLSFGRPTCFSWEY